MGRNFDDYPGPVQKKPCLKICNTLYVLQYIDICSGAVFHVS